MLRTKQLSKAVLVQAANSRDVGVLGSSEVYDDGVGVVGGRDGRVADDLVEVLAARPHGSTVQAAVQGALRVGESDGGGGREGRDTEDKVEVSAARQHGRITIHAELGVLGGIGQVDDDVEGGGGRRQVQGAVDKKNEVVADVKGTNDPIGDSINEKRKSRINSENLTLKTEDFLEKSKPENSRRNIKTALNAFKAVLEELHPDESRDVKELPNETLADYLEEFFRSVLKEDGTCYNASTWLDISWMRRS